MIIPNYVKKYIDEDGLKRVEKTIAQVEENTSAELVSVVVKHSSSTGHVPAIILLLGLLIYFIFDLRFIFTCITLQEFQKVYFRMAWFNFFDFNYNPFFSKNWIQCCFIRYIFLTF